MLGSLFNKSGAGNAGMIKGLFKLINSMGINLDDVKDQLFDFIHERFYSEQKRVEEITKKGIDLIPVIKANQETIYFNYLLVQGDKITGTFYQDDKNMKDIVSDFDIKQFLENLKNEAEEDVSNVQKTDLQPGEEATEDE